MTFDPAKPVQLRDGREARVLCIDLDHSRSIVAAYQIHEGSQELVRSFYRNGKARSCFEDNPNDLINKTETRYINIWRASSGDIYCTSIGYYTKGVAEAYAKAMKNRTLLHIGLEIKV